MVRVVLQVERDRRAHPGGLQGGLGLVEARASVAVAVQVLEDGRGAGEPVGYVRVQRRVGVLVDLLRDGGAVDEVRRGLAHGEGLLGVGFRRLRSVGHRVEVEDDVPDLTARAGDDIDVLVLREAVDVGRRQAAVGDVDGVLLDVELHVGGVGVVLHVHRGGGRLAQDPLIVRVGLVGDQVVEVVARDVVLAGERVALDDGLVRRHLVGREDLLVDDRTGRARKHLGESLVVRHLELEVDGGLVRGGHAVEVREQRGGAVRVVDLQLTVERELDVGRGQVVSVGELESRLELDSEVRRGGEAGRHRDVGLHVGAAVRRVEQERIDLVHHRERTVVVRACRIDRRDLVGRSDR